MVSLTRMQINTKTTNKKKLFSLIKKNIRQRFIYIIGIYWHHSFIIAMSPCFSILNQTRIMTTIQISTTINNSSKIKFSCTKYLILYFSNHLNERWNKKRYRVLSNSTIWYKRLSCTIKHFPTLVKESLESLSLITVQILQYGALDPKILFLKLWQVRLENLWGQEKEV